MPPIGEDPNGAPNNTLPFVASHCGWAARSAERFRGRLRQVGQNGHSGLHSRRGLGPADVAAQRVAVGTGLTAAIGPLMLIFKSPKAGGGRPVRVTPQQKLDEWVDCGVFFVAANCDF